MTRRQDPVWQQESPADWPERPCQEIPVDAFFPDRRRDAEGAIRVCQGCPKRAKCADWALSAELTYCVVGGVYLPGTGAARVKALNELRAVAESGDAANDSDKEGGAAWTAA